MSVVSLAQEFDVAVAAMQTAKADEATKMEAYFQSQDVTRNAVVTLEGSKKKLLDAIEAEAFGTVQTIVEDAVTRIPVDVPASETAL